LAKPGVASREIQYSFIKQPIRKAYSAVLAELRRGVSVTTTYSALLASSEGRYMTALEEERALAASLELPRRMLVSRLLQECEFNIIDYATNAFCEISPDFEGEQGSVRRKKGHQDGRIILRYVAQAVREGSPDILFEKVLSWLVGHLDSRNVSGRHMEVFFHFIQQGARRELPAETHAFFDVIFEQVIDFVRISSHSGTIQRAHRRIAEFAVNRVMAIVPDAKARYGASSAPKCKRDFEMLVKELARIMKCPSEARMKEDFSRWLIDRLMNQVEYPAEVWYWSFLALREGIYECCGPEAARAVHGLFETMADRSVQLQEAVKLATAAGDIASRAADRLLESGEPLGLLRTDEFKTAVGMVNRQVVTELAVLHACGGLESGSNRLSELWCTVVLPLMPTSDTNHLAANLNALLKSIDDKELDDVRDVFRTAVMRLVEVARTSESASRLTGILDQVVSEAADRATDASGATASVTRACYNDIRAVLARMVEMIAGGASSAKQYEFRSYLVRYVLPNRTMQLASMKQAYETVLSLIEKHAVEEDARLARSFLQQVGPCLERHARLASILGQSDRFAVHAVERGYQAAPRHESLSRHGVQAGRRDGAFLLERLIMTAVIGGSEADKDLHLYFVNEQVRLSRLPGGVIVEFLRGIQEQLREFPEVLELVTGLAQNAAGYAAALKLDLHSNELARVISEQAINGSNTYRAAIDEKGAAACVRDNSVMIRGLAAQLVDSPLDVAPFKAWWKKTIGQHLNAKPDGFQADNPWGAINHKGLVQAMSTAFDAQEIDAVEDFFRQVVATEHSGGRKSPMAPTGAITGNSKMGMSFTDVIV
jgi:hypothetical protein